MQYIDQSEVLTGYRAGVFHKAAFQVVGFTLIVPPKSSSNMVPNFYDQVIADGRMEKLKKASSIPTWMLGLSSWDEECEKKGFRYTICIEATEYTDFSPLENEYELFTKQIGESDWLSFEMTQEKYFERFWKDNPYKMMGPLGYKFNMQDLSVGLHFDAYPPDYEPVLKPRMEFWITVENL